ncbi:MULTISPECIES: polysaccharide deacetylase family protein [Cellulosilyticum]|uniref:Polysaccharide deacetylase n=1 Tax=Cellulosilyticum lentocellum (strain ATCC 49066 / DSM 5427 / NCIMB 11756 / RHM5) TaxID=642492 RepID=F2JQ73_CELLD|nr:MULTISPECIES: polysaccharide deacetylase family protein [Cellulosilyticum]ADZ82621.1 polysaccharide deacetylase [Cellulosilyticum lentocellum DSM 5427]QEH68242.1 polysaccharide deacetylase family protein [Cellulosilyticum sp. WCF-2]
MAYRKKSRVGATLVFLFLSIFFVCTTGVLAFKMPNKVQELSGVKKELAEIEASKVSMQADLEDYSGRIEQIKEQVGQVKLDLEEAQKKNPELANSLAGATEKYAYLTFDDGPSDNTVKILDFLKANHLKATFFVLGKENQDDIYKRIVDEGHTLAIHSNTHQYNQIYTSVDSFMQDINALSNHLESVTGVKPDVMRFPGGSNNTISIKHGGKDLMDQIIAKVKEEGLVYFDWNVDSMDASANKQDKNVIVNSVLNGAEGQKHAIILMHDAAPKTTTVEALPEIVEGLRKQGFTFEKLTSETVPVQFKK